MTETNINLRNASLPITPSKMTDDFSKYLGNTAPDSNN